jgi:hypothetical protein
MKGADKDTFLRYMRSGIIVVDIRMHIKESGGVRNHGTGFRIEERYIADCFDTKVSLLE